LWINNFGLLASGQKMEGFKGRKFFAREPQSRRLRFSAESSRKLPFPFRRKIGARKSKNVEAIFLRGRPPSSIGGWRRGIISDFVSWICGLNSVK